MPGLFDSSLTLLANRSAAASPNFARITGIIASIESGLNDKPYVVIGSGEPPSFNRLHCRPKDPSRALALSKGHKITIWGIGGNELAGSLALEHCDW